MAATSSTCSVCCAANYKTCQCPWGKSFDQWPTAKISKLKSIAFGGPRPGS